MSTNHNHTAPNDRHDRQKNAAFYIDGFNLYYGVKALKKPEYKWLDIAQMCRFLLSKEENAALKNIKYFTAMVKDNNKDGQKVDRQKKFIDAIGYQDDIEIIKGKFRPRDFKCYACNTVHKSYEEKQTDVNIACHLLKDAYENRYDTAIIISADSDLVTPVKMLREAGKRAIVWAPPKRHSEELSQTADVYQKIFHQTIAAYPLPETVRLKSGYSIGRPVEWGGST